MSSSSGSTIAGKAVTPNFMSTVFNLQESCKPLAIWGDLIPIPQSAMSRNEVNSSSALYPARKEHSHLWSTSVEPGFLLTPLEPPEKKDSLDDGMDVKIDFGIWLAEPYDSGDQDSAIQEAGHPSIHPLQSFQQPSEIGQSPLNGSSEVSKIPSDRSPPSDLVAPRYTPPDEAHRQAVLGLFADIMDDAAATAAQEYKYLDLGPLAGSEIMQERIEMQQMRQEEQKASYAQQSHLTSAGFVLTDFDVIAAIEKMQAGMDVQQVRMEEQRDIICSAGSASSKRS